MPFVTQYTKRASAPPAGPVLKRSTYSTTAKMRLTSVPKTVMGHAAMHRKGYVGEERKPACTTPCRPPVHPFVRLVGIGTAHLIAV